VAYLTATVAIGIGGTSLSIAQQVHKHLLDIPAQDLSSALTALSAAANEQVLFSKDLVSNLRSPALKGEYTTDEALTFLLKSSGLQAERTSSGVLLIRYPKAATPPPTVDAQQSVLQLAQAERASESPAQATAGPEVASVQTRDDVEELTEVTITGTRIRGVAPVGSSTISMDQATMQQSGLMTTNEVINTIPSVLPLGNGNNIAAGTQIQNGFSGTYGNSANIRGLGPGATLSLVNGHRVFNEGIIGNAFDPNNLPVQMIARVEVVQDGTSPIYGADAVAGTINYILRQPADTFETYAGSNWSDGQNNWYATGILGQVWHDENPERRGGFIASYQYSEQGSMNASAFRNLYDDDFSRFGGSPSLSFASPGNVLIGGTTYAVPAGQNGEALTLSQLGAAGSVNRQNGWTGLQPLPDMTSNRVSLNFNQNITPSIQLFGDGIYSRRTFSRLANGASNNLAVAVPNSNPFSPCNPSHYANGIVTGPASLVAACADGLLRVNYSSIDLAGPRINSGLSELWQVSAGSHIALPADWQLTVQATTASQLQDTGTSTINAPDPATFNFFCDDSAFQCNPAGTLTQLPWVTGTGTNGPTRGRFRYYLANVDGALFSVPAGEVRLAAGLEYDDLKASRRTGTKFDVGRTVKSGFVELYIPLLSPVNGVPGIYKLELDIAGRVDSYSDTGTTTNPKIGINWSPFPDLRVHASFGRSFHPAPMQNLASLNPTWQSLPLAASAISPALCPRCTDPALYGSGGANKLVYNEAMGADSGLIPETSRSYSFGADWSPEALHGLVGSINYWWIKYINQVGNPQNNAGPAGQINQQYFNGHLIYNPTFFPELALNNPLAYFEPIPRANLADPNCAAVVGQRVVTQTQFNQFVQCANNSLNGPPSANGQSLTGAIGSPNDVLAFGYYGQQNAGSTLADGIDLSASYSWKTEQGAWKAGVIAEYVNRFEVSVITGAPVIDQVDRFGYPLRFKGRGQLGWARTYGFGGLAANLFVNYSSGYKMDLSLLAPGVPQSYADIDSYTTADLSLLYNTKDALGSWLGRDVTIGISAQNLFDSTPPLVLNPAGGGGPGLLFDPANAFPLGRTVQVRIGKTW
jgi:iron complex outermembrane receptor protein